MLNLERVSHQSKTLDKLPQLLLLLLTSARVYDGGQLHDSVERIVLQKLLLTATHDSEFVLSDVVLYDTFEEGHVLPGQMGEELLRFADRYLGAQSHANLFALHLRRLHVPGHLCDHFVEDQQQHHSSEDELGVAVLSKSEGNADE